MNKGPQCNRERVEKAELVFGVPNDYFPVAILHPSPQTQSEMMQTKAMLQLQYSRKNKQVGQKKGSRREHGEVKL